MITFAQFVLDYTKWWTIITFAATMIFLGYYTVSAPWWATPFGRAIVALDLGIGIAIMPGFVFYVFDVNIMNERATSILLMFALAAVPGIILYRLYTLWAIKHKQFWKKLHEAVSKDRSTP